MILRIIILFVPSLLGLLWQDDPWISLAWSFAGSLLIAGTAQTLWFSQSNEDVPITHRLLRPMFIYHFFFVGYHVVGGVVNSWDLAGYTLWGTPAGQSEYELSLNATAQGLMLLAQASVTAGMKLAGLRYGPPKYVIAFLPPYGLLVLSLSCLVVANALSSFALLSNLNEKILQIASTAVLVEITLALSHRKFKNAAWAISLLCVNLLSQIVSGWKGLSLWTMITLGALLYPLMPRRVLLSGVSFVLFWALYLHPFGLALRPLLWYEGVDRETAIAQSIDETLSMSFEERLENVWTLMTGRANDLYQFRKYLEFVPNVRPYFGIDLLVQAHIGLVPRILWPEKPDLEILAMQRVYDAEIAREQSGVSAKSNFYQDAYLSWGWSGVLIAGVIFGFLGIFISRTCEQLFGGYEIGTCLIFTSLFAPTFNMAPNFLFFAGTIWSSVIVMIAVFYIAHALGWIVAAEPSVRAALPEATVVEGPTV